MKAFLNWLKVNLGLVNRIFLFLVAAIVVVYMFPRQGKFLYEYQQGSPWKHNDLIADGQIPIIKTDQELQKEYDSILKNFSPYFNYKTEVGLEQIKRFKTSFIEEFNEYSRDKFNLEDVTTFNSSRRYAPYRLIRDKYLDQVSSLLLKVYEKGILEITEKIDIEDVEGAIVIVKFSLAEQTDIREVFTQKTAYQYIDNLVTENLLKEKLRGVDQYDEFFNDLALERFISANLDYDQERSDEIKQTLLARISPNIEALKDGQLIIERGDIVTPEKYRLIESFRRHYEDQLGKSSKYNIIFWGKVILVASCFIVMFLFLYHYRRDVFENYRHVLFILFIVVALVLATRVAQHFQDYFSNSIYWLPFTLLPIVLRTFFDSRLALFVHFVTTLLVGFYAPNGFEFIFLNFIAGNAAIFTLTNSNRRRKIVVTSVLVTLSYSVTYFGFSITRSGSFNFHEQSEVFIWFALNGLLLFMAYPMIYIFEKMFGFVSDATLLELADTNQPLLRKLAEKAPGTFQHSMQVASLAEEAIHQIGGNALLARTGALYHDIGKMENPIYFIENQSDGVNPHDRLEFSDSAKIIIGHVYKGIEIAKKNNLPGVIIDFIRTHHGTSTVQYFYRNHIKQNPDQQIDIKDFMYPGPKPYSKETAVLMMADSVEAASRSLKEINEETINNLVDTIITYQQTEEQFNDANITFKEISVSKEIFKKRLKDIYHARISYPKA